MCFSYVGVACSIYQFSIVSLSREWLIKMASGLKRFLPRTRVDAFAMSITFIMIPSAYVHGAFNVLPGLYSTTAEYLTDEQVEENRSTYRLHMIFMTYLLAIVLWDLAFTLTTDSSCKGVSLPQMSQPGWNYCPYCKQHAPPRAYHCLSCEKCILRRDHHCYFVGQCIGYHNHRHFLLFVFHASITLLYAFILSLMLIFKINGGFSLLVLGSAIFPMIGWLLQLVHVNLLVMMGTSLSIMFMVITMVMFGVSVKNLYNGQTFWEGNKGVRRDPGWMKNAADVLGSRWWLTWLCPFIPSPLPGDGCHYPSRGNVAPRPAPAQEGGRRGARKTC